MLTSVMEGWKRGIWATAGAVVVVLALAITGTWYLATNSLSLLNPLVISCGALVVAGTYVALAALGDGPLPGRETARRRVEELEKVEAVRRERLAGIREHLAKVIADAKIVEARCRAAGLEPPGEALLAGWTNDARACIAKIDAKLLPAFNQQGPAGGSELDGQQPDPEHMVALLNARVSFLVQLLKGRPS